MTGVQTCALPISPMNPRRVVFRAMVDTSVFSVRCLYLSKKHEPCGSNHTPQTTQTQLNTPATPRKKTADQAGTAVTTVHHVADRGPHAPQHTRRAGYGSARVWNTPPSPHMAWMPHKKNTVQNPRVTPAARHRPHHTTPLENHSTQRRMRPSSSKSSPS